MDIRQEKQRLQQSIRERLDRLDAQGRAAESRSICRRILENLPPGTKVVCAYVPLKSEVDVHPLLKEFLARGIALYLPCYEKTLVFRRAENLQSLIMGDLKIPEPPPESEQLDPDILDLAIVPGRAFDRLGNRLGRGNGGYDRWIHAQRARNPRTKYWGVGFECQVVDTVPMEDHDERIDAVITARALFPAD